MSGVVGSGRAFWLQTPCMGWGLNRHLSGLNPRIYEPVRRRYMAEAEALDSRDQLGGE